ncbi:MAG: Crp/Fnr family transcriptional regulator [Chitinophagaceae bacterium]
MNDIISQLIQLFQSKGRTIVLSKGEFLIKENDPETHLYLVEQGSLRAFYQSEHEEHTIRLGYQGNIINSLGAYLSGQGSELYIEALKKTQVKALHKTDIEALIAQSSEHTRSYLRLIEQLIVQQIEREIDLLIESPSERLERVLKRSPHLFQHIPLKYIASYLRMSPETLSRIKKII